MCDHSGEGGNSLQVDLCARDTLLTPTLCWVTWTEELSFAGVASSHIPPILIFWVFRYNCDILLGFGLYSFPLAFCLLCASVVLQSMWF